MPALAAPLARLVAAVSTVVLDKTCTWSTRDILKRTDLLDD